MGMYLSLALSDGSPVLPEPSPRNFLSGDVAVRFRGCGRGRIQCPLIIRSSGLEPRPQLGPLCARSRHRAHVASDIAPSRARGSLRCLASRSAAPNIRISTLLLRVLKLDPELTPIPRGNPMKFRPLHDRVVLRRLEGEEKTKGGIIIPDTAKEKPQEGEVVAVGPGGRDEAGKLLPIDLKPGDRVLFGKWSGTEVKIDGEELLIMKESDVMGVLEGAKASRKVA